MQRLPTEPVEPFWYPATNSRYDGPGTVIGSDYTMVFVEADDGVVWTIDPEGEMLTRFVNSSVDQFASFLSVVPGRWDALVGLDDDAAMRQLDSLVAELLSVDSAAFRDVESYWSVFVEQVRDGQL